MHRKPFARIVLTGAAGRLGRMLRTPLRELADTLILSDRVPLSEAPQANEQFIACDLADHAAVHALLGGAELVVHMGGIALERSFDQILHSNIVGQFNIYDNALSQGVRRVILASSNHVTGFYHTDERVSPAMPMRPDSLYGVSKAYGELLARFYHDRHALESVCLRIGSCYIRPRNARCLNSWLSPGDLCELVRRAALAPNAGFAVVYGVSDNPGRWWEADDAARIGYQPRDSSTPFFAEYAAELAADTAAAAARRALQGGVAATLHDYRQPQTLNPDPHPEPLSEDMLQALLLAAQRAATRSA